MKSGTKGIYHRYFSSLRGVDVTSDPAEVSLSRFADMANMWRDPLAPEGTVTETFPGYRGIGAWEGECLGLYRHRVGAEDFLVAHVGTRLYRFPVSMRHYPRTLSALTPLREGVAATQGFSFPVGESLYLFIGGTCYRLSPDGILAALGEEGCLPYLPTTFVEGEAYEQRNMLTDRVKHRFTLTEHTFHAETNIGLSFTVLDEEAATCSVRAVSSLSSTTLRIPETAVIGGKQYTVRAIAEYGFAALPALRCLYLPDTLREIGAFAFSANPLLDLVSVPDSTERIGSHAFYDCEALKTVYLGKGLRQIQSGAFRSCPIQTVRLGGSKEEADALLSNQSSLFDTSGILFRYRSTPVSNPFALFRLPVPEPCLSLDEAVLDETPLAVNGTSASLRLRVEKRGGLISDVWLEADDVSLVQDRRLTLFYTVKTGTVSVAGSTPSSEKDGGWGSEAVLGCTCACAFDGRMFYSGNPLFPGTVFYSSTDGTGYNDPLYVGVLNYFKDGLRPATRYTLVSLGDRLAVVAGDDEGEGEIFLHAPAATGEDLLPRVYPLDTGVVGAGCFGEAVTFGREVLLLTAQGLMALRRSGVSDSYALFPRSTAVNSRLCKENLSKARMAVHEGLLYVLTEGRVYLAYATEGTEYEWYLLSGIGCYTGGSMVARYTDRLPEEAESLFTHISVHPRVGDLCHGTVSSVRLSDGSLFYYVTEEGEDYPIDAEGEYTGGDFSPATRLCATREVLFFGAASGGVGCFNTDLRGKAACVSLPSPLYALYEGEYLSLRTPARLPVPEEATLLLPLYRKEGDRYLHAGEGRVFLDTPRFASFVISVSEDETSEGIHPLFYSFDGRRYPAFLLLPPDDGGLPHYRKDTLAGSATAKLKALCGAPTVLVRTDRHPFRACDRVGPAVFDFASGDFSAMDFHGDGFASLSLREKERGWSYKQYLFRSEGFRSPFGVYSLTYSYYPSGRPKG